MKRLRWVIGCLGACLLGACASSEPGASPASSSCPTAFPREGERCSSSGLVCPSPPTPCARICGEGCGSETATCLAGGTWRVVSNPGTPFNDPVTCGVGQVSDASVVADAAADGGGADGGLDASADGSRDAASE
ncbi:MAG: hypothetical protein IPF92_02935 [Myxococcales bacterium]|nr:hypothetical protein [Myxococcales bacterium]MBL0197253.1 hypothetical protein [Myxococcales bacterium]